MITRSNRGPKAVRGVWYLKDNFLIYNDKENLTLTYSTFLMYKKSVKSFNTGNFACCRTCNTQTVKPSIKKVTQCAFKCQGIQSSEWAFFAV